MEKKKKAIEILERLNEAKKNNKLDAQLSLDALEFVIKSADETYKMQEELIDLKDKVIDLKNEEIKLREKESEDLIKFGGTMTKTMYDFIKKDDERLLEFIAYMTEKLVESQDKNKQLGEHVSEEIRASILGDKPAI